MASALRPWSINSPADQTILLINLGKCLSLPLLAGLPLGLRWSRLPPFGRAFICANFIPKITAVGALYLMAA
jgi:hypothetical protein